MDFNHVPNPTRLQVKAIVNVVINLIYLAFTIKILFLLVSENCGLLPIKTAQYIANRNYAQLTITFTELKHNLLKLWVIYHRLYENLTINSKLNDPKFLYSLFMSKLPQSDHRLTIAGPCTFAVQFKNLEPQIAERFPNKRKNIQLRLQFEAISRTRACQNCQKSRKPWQRRNY